MPTHWNELSKKQLLAIAQILYGANDINKTILQLLKILTGMKWIRFLRAPAAELQEFIYLVYFLINKNELTKQLLPCYKKFYGPADDFNNLLMCEFVFAEDFFLRYQQSEEKEKKLLDELIAVLYRPGKWQYDLVKNVDGDPRIPFNENICHWHGNKEISKWPVHIKNAILTWYKGCREKLISDNSEIFNGAGEPAKYGLLSVIRSIATSHVHGNFDEVQMKPVKIIMMELNEMHQEAEKLKEHG